jgi:mannitol/fructose-specific phosphotransferase system IIA component (Ntr-type)
MIWENVVDFFIITKKGKESIIELLEKSGYSSMINEIVDEKKMFMYSIGKGIYFIRTMIDIDEEEVYIGVSEEDTGLKSFDGIPVKIIILLFHPKDKKNFVKFVSFFFRLLNIPSVRNEIIKAKDVDEVKGILKREPV